MSISSIADLLQRLQNALDSSYNVTDMATVLEVISTLERTTVTKEQLETTRMGKYINQLRRKTHNEQLAKRLKNLLKKWREMVIPTIPSASSTTAINVSGAGVVGVQHHIRQQIESRKTTIQTVQRVPHQQQSSNSLPLLQSMPRAQNGAKKHQQSQQTIDLCRSPPTITTTALTFTTSIPTTVTQSLPSPLLQYTTTATTPQPSSSTSSHSIQQQKQQSKQTLLSNHKLSLKNEHFNADNMNDLSTITTAAAANCIKTQKFIAGPLSFANLIGNAATSASTLTNHQSAITTVRKSPNIMGAIAVKDDHHQRHASPSPQFLHENDNTIDIESDDGDDANNQEECARYINNSRRHHAHHIRQPFGQSNDDDDDVEDNDSNSKTMFNVRDADDGAAVHFNADDANSRGFRMDVDNWSPSLAIITGGAGNRSRTGNDDNDPFIKQRLVNGVRLRCSQNDHRISSPVFRQTLSRTNLTNSPLCSSSLDAQDSNSNSSSFIHHRRHIHQHGDNGVEDGKLAVGPTTSSQCPTAGDNASISRKHHTKKAKKDKKQKHRERTGGNGGIENDTEAAVSRGNPIGFVTGHGNGSDNIVQRLSADDGQPIVFDPPDSLSSSSISLFNNTNHSTLVPTATPSAVTVPHGGTSGSNNTVNNNSTTSKKLIKSSELTFTGKFSSKSDDNEADVIINLDSSTSSSSSRSSSPINQCTTANINHQRRQNHQISARLRKLQSNREQQPQRRRERPTSRGSPLLITESQSCGSPLRLLADHSNYSLADDQHHGGGSLSHGIAVHHHNLALHNEMMAAIAINSTVTSSNNSMSEDTVTGDSMTAISRHHQQLQQHQQQPKKRGRKKGSAGADRRLWNTSECMSGTHGYDTTTLIGLKNKINSIRWHTKKVKTTKELLAELQNKNSIITSRSNNSGCAIGGGDIVISDNTSPTTSSAIIVNHNEINFPLLTGSMTVDQTATNTSSTSSPILPLSSNSRAVASPLTGSENSQTNSTTDMRSTTATPVSLLSMAPTPEPHLASNALISIVSSNPSTTINSTSTGSQFFGTAGRNRMIGTRIGGSSDDFDLHSTLKCNSMLYDDNNGENIPTSNGAIFTSTIKTIDQQIAELKAQLPPIDHNEIQRMCAAELTILTTTTTTTPVSTTAISVDTQQTYVCSCTLHEIAPIVPVVVVDETIESLTSAAAPLSPTLLVHQKHSSTFNLTNIMKKNSTTTITSMSPDMAKHIPIQLQSASTLLKKPIKSIFDLDYEDDDDPIHLFKNPDAKLTANNQSSTNKKETPPSATNNSINRPENQQQQKSQPSQLIDNGNGSNSSGSGGSNSSSSSSSTSNSNSSGAIDTINHHFNNNNSDNRPQVQVEKALHPSTQVPPQPPFEQSLPFTVYEIHEDPNCPAKSHFITEKNRICEYHIQHLHNYCIPNVNGNWNELKTNDSITTTPSPLSLTTAIPSIEQHTELYERVVPQYNHLCMDSIPKNIAHIDLLVNERALHMHYRHRRHQRRRRRQLQLHQRFQCHNNKDLTIKLLKNEQHNIDDNISVGDGDGDDSRVDTTTINDNKAIINKNEQHNTFIGHVNDTNNMKICNYLVVGSGSTTTTCTAATTTTTASLMNDTDNNPFSQISHQQYSIELSNNAKQKSPQIHSSDYAVLPSLRPPSPHVNIPPLLIKRLQSCVNEYNNESSNGSGIDNDVEVFNNCRQQQQQQQQQRRRQRHHHHHHHRRYHRQHNDSEGSAKEPTDIQMTSPNECGSSGSDDAGSTVNVLLSANYAVIAVTDADALTSCKKKRKRKKHHKNVKYKIRKNSCDMMPSFSMISTTATTLMEKNVIDSNKPSNHYRINGMVNDDGDGPTVIVNFSSSDTTTSKTEIFQKTTDGIASEFQPPNRKIILKLSRQLTTEDTDDYANEDDNDDDDDDDDDEEEEEDDEYSDNYDEKQIEIDDGDNGDNTRDDGDNACDDENNVNIEEDENQNNDNHYKHYVDDDAGDVDIDDNDADNDDDKTEIIADEDFVDVIVEHADIEDNFNSQIEFNEQKQLQQHIGESDVVDDVANNNKNKLLTNRDDDNDDAVINTTAMHDSTTKIDNRQSNHDRIDSNDWHINVCADKQDKTISTCINTITTMTSTTTTAIIGNHKIESNDKNMDLFRSRSTFDVHADDNRNCRRSASESATTNNNNNNNTNNSNNSGSGDDSSIGIHHQEHQSFQSVHPFSEVTVTTTTTPPPLSPAPLLLPTDKSIKKRLRTSSIMSCNSSCSCQMLDIDNGNDCSGDSDSDANNNSSSDIADDCDCMVNNIISVGDNIDKDNSNANVDAVATDSQTIIADRQEQQRKRCAMHKHEFRSTSDIEGWMGKRRRKLCGTPLPMENNEFLTSFNELTTANECGVNEKTGCEFKEWHQVVHVKSYNDEILTILPYVVID